jgi:hypothetical protein
MINTRAVAVNIQAVSAVLIDVYIGIDLGIDGKQKANITIRNRIIKGNLDKVFAIFRYFGITSYKYLDF